MSTRVLKGIVLSALAVMMPVTSFAADTIKIGVAGAHSGELASYGVPTLMGVQMVADEVNAKGGLLGKQIEIVAQDDQCKPEIATNVAARLISEEVDAVVGHICSGAAKAASALYTNAKIITVSPSVTAPVMTVSGENPYFLRTIADDNASAVVGVKFALQKLGVKKFAILHDNGEYGKGYADHAKKLVEESGLGEVVLFESVTPGAADYSSVVRKLRRAGAEVFMWGGYYPEASKILANMYSLNINIPFIGPDGLKDQGFIELAGQDAEGVFASGPTDTSANPLSKQYAAAFTEKHGTATGAFFDNGVAAAIALFNAIEKAGSTDTDKVMAALRENEVETPVGAIKFDAKGDALGVGMSIYEIEDGQYHQVF